MKLILSIFIITFIVLGCTNQVEDFKLKNGDLLFQDIDCGPFCQAIEKVTFGIHGAKLSHIGMLNYIKGEAFVIEAGGNGVVQTPLDTFLNRSFDAEGKPKVIVGRLKEDKLIKEAIKNAQSRLGKVYDDVFDIDNDSYYCSELIYHSFKEANDGEEVFKLFPMTFIDPDTDSTFGIWVDYYNDLNQPIPEGKPGLNPGGISKSEHLLIVHEYGQPEGYYH